MEPYEFVAIGDTVIDAFIRLKEASVGKDAMGSPELRMPFATKVPYEEAFVLDAVGNAPNGATAAARLGLKTAIITSVGNDDYGRRCLAAFQKNGISAGNENMTFSATGNEITCGGAQDTQQQNGIQWPC